MKRLVYEAREDPTKVQAYVDGLKAEINKVGDGTAGVFGEKCTGEVE